MCNQQRVSSNNVNNLEVIWVRRGRRFEVGLCKSKFNLNFLIGKIFQVI